MTYIKINDINRPASIRGWLKDAEWGDRDSKAITLEMDYHTAMNTFVDGLEWSIVTVNDIQQVRVDEYGIPVLDEKNQPIIDTVELIEEFDNSDYCVAGSVADNRNGTVTVKMGKKTDAEMLAELREVLNA